MIQTNMKIVTTRTIIASLSFGCMITALMNNQIWATLFFGSLVGYNLEIWWIRQNNDA